MGEVGPIAALAFAIAVSAKRARVRRRRSAGLAAASETSARLSSSSARCWAWDQLHPRLGLARLRRAAAGHRGHGHPAGRREAAQRRGEPAGLALVVAHRRHRGRPRPLLASVSPPFRPGAHVPPAQADARLDPAPPARLGGGRPMDLDRDRRPHPAPPRPTARRRPPPPLGAVGGTEQTHPHPRPTWVQEPPHEDPLTSASAETHLPRTGPATRPEEQAIRRPPRSGQSSCHRRGLRRPAHHKKGTKPRPTTQTAEGPLNSDSATATA